MGRAEADTGMVEPANFFERRHLACGAKSVIGQLAAILPYCLSADRGKEYAVTVKPSMVIGRADPRDVNFYGVVHWIGIAPIICIAAKPFNTKFRFI
jgi:hypothetical protein